MMERVSLLDMMTADEIRRLIKRQKAEIDGLVRWATKIINEEIEYGYTSKQTLDEGQELIAKHRGKGE